MMNIPHTVLLIALIFALALAQSGRVVFVQRLAFETTFLKPFLHIELKQKVKRQVAMQPRGWSPRPPRGPKRSQAPEIGGSKTSVFAISQNKLSKHRNSRLKIVRFFKCCQTCPPRRAKYRARRFCPNFKKIKILRDFFKF